MPGRWPIHPVPYVGESLSSWLERIAHAYGYLSQDLLVYDLGFEAMPAWKLDINPPERLLRELCERTGVPFDQTRAMTLQSFAPLLIDGLDPKPDLFQTYVGGHSFLYPAALRPLPEIKDWVPWLQLSPFDSEQVCLVCLREKPQAYRRLSWRMAWMVTCPIHHVMLDNMYFTIFDDLDAILEKPETAPPELVDLDHLTNQAVEKGTVSLPRREVHGGIWLRLLRALIDELSLPVNSVKRYRPAIASVWRKLGLEVRQGLQGTKVPFEKMRREQQILLMRAAGFAVSMMRSQEFKQNGEGTILFEPLPIDKKDLPSLPISREQMKVNKFDFSSEYELAWGNLMGLIEEFRAKMRENPDGCGNFQLPSFRPKSSTD